MKIDIGNKIAVNIEGVAELLDISRAEASWLVAREDFPKLALTTDIEGTLQVRIPIDLLREWVRSQVNPTKKAEIPKKIEAPKKKEVAQPKPGAAVRSKLFRK